LADRRRGQERTHLYPASVTLPARDRYVARSRTAERAGVTVPRRGRQPFPRLAEADPLRRTGVGNVPRAGGLRHARLGRKTLEWLVVIVGGVVHRVSERIPVAAASDPGPSLNWIRRLAASPGTLTPATSGPVAGVCASARSGARCDSPTSFRLPSTSF
jgi:hypothetical protein